MDGPDPVDAGERLADASADRLRGVRRHDRAPESRRPADAGVGGPASPDQGRMECLRQRHGQGGT